MYFKQSVCSTELIKNVFFWNSFSFEILFGSFPNDARNRDIGKDSLMIMIRELINISLI